MADSDPKPRIGTLIGIVAVASVALLAWIVFRVTHPQPVREMTAVDAELLVKGPMGALLFGNGKPIAVTQQNGLESRGLIAEYYDNPEKFKAYAELFDTAMNAIQLGKQVSRSQNHYQFPFDSTALPGLEQTRDAWNHPYCISRVGTTIAIVSGGPSASSFNCGKQKTRVTELTAPPRPTFQSSTGEVVTIVHQSTN